MVLLLHLQKLARMNPALLPVQMVLAHQRARSWDHGGSHVSISGWVPRQRSWSWNWPWPGSMSLTPNILKSQSFSWRRSTQLSRYGLRSFH